MESKLLVAFLCCQVNRTVMSESDFFLFLLDLLHDYQQWQYHALPLVLELGEESHLPFFLLSRLHKFSLLPVSVRLTVKQVRVTEFKERYNCSCKYK